MTNVKSTAAATATATATGNASTYRFFVGDVTAIAISDGQAQFPAYPAYASNADEADVREALRGHGLDEHDYLLNATALVLITATATVLIDAGAGAALGPGFGRLPRGLRSVGLAPRDIDTLHITHAHLDHIGGLVDAEGKTAFPGARLSLSSAEWQYWTDEDLDLSGLPVDTAFRDAFAATARRALPPYAERLALFADDAELVPGITATRTGAHTPGHSVVGVDSAGQTLLVVGDLFHHEAFDLAHPEWCTAFDWQPEQMPALRPSGSRGRQTHTRLRLPRPVSRDRTRTASWLCVSLRSPAMDTRPVIDPPIWRFPDERVPRGQDVSGGRAGP